MNSKQATSHYSLPNLCTPQAVLFAVILAELLAFIVVLIAEGLSPFNWQMLALVSLFLQWVVLLCSAILCRIRRLLPRWSVVVGAGVCYLSVLLVCLLSSVASQWLLAGTFITGEFGQIDILWVARNTVIAAVLAGIVLRYLYLAEQVSERKQAELQGQIAALQSRIRPHFLFNTMNSIASLIGFDPKSAERAVEDLCSLFRASLTDKAVVSVKEELLLCERYLAIEQLRLGNRLQVDWQVEVVPDDLTIPNLSLQPLLENAIYHGIQAIPAGGVIAIAGEFQKGVLIWTITNPLAESGSPSEGHGIAIENIRNRLQALYGDTAELAVSQGQNMFSCTLRYSPSKLNEAIA